MRVSDWSSDVCSSDLAWNGEVDAAIAASADDVLPSDTQVLGAVQAAVADDAIVVCAAGGLPGELHKLWRTASPRGYHVEYGYSCMGYEIAGGLGVKMAEPQREVVVLRSEEHTSELQTLMSISYAVFCVTKKNTREY